MARKSALRVLRTGTVINVTAKDQEKEHIQALIQVVKALETKHKVRLRHTKTIYLSKIVSKLEEAYPGIPFAEVLPNSHMRPDGGILYLLDKQGQEYPILISEVKNQGTNDARLKEGKPVQAMGNAIERLGKNVIGLRSYMMGEGIFPFVCFGYGWDFSEGSSILDRVITINMFGELNTDGTHNLGEQGQFNRGSFYFRREKWSTQEMADIMLDIASRSIYHYFSRQGDAAFI